MQNQGIELTEDGSEKTLMTDLRIREMQLSDLDRVCELEKACFSDPWPRQSFARDVAENAISHPFVVLSGNEIVGYAVYRCIDRETEITNFAIAPDFRRRHVGSFLLGCIVSDILRKGIEDVHLELRGANDAARNLYLKHGFKEVGVRKDYYVKQKDDAVLMTLSLRED